MFLHFLSREMSFTSCKRFTLNIFRPCCLRDWANCLSVIWWPLFSWCGSKSVLLKIMLVCPRWPCGWWDIKIQGLTHSVLTHHWLHCTSQSSLSVCWASPSTPWLGFCTSLASLPTPATQQKYNTITTQVLLSQLQNSQPSLLIASMVCTPSSSKPTNCFECKLKIPFLLPLGAVIIIFLIILLLLCIFGGCCFVCFSGFHATGHWKMNTGSSMCAMTLTAHKWRIKKHLNKHLTCNKSLLAK